MSAKKPGIITLAVCAICLHSTLLSNAFACPGVADVYFINGVYNNQQDAELSRFQLQKMVESSISEDCTPPAVKTNWNQTDNWLADPLQAADQVKHGVSHADPDLLDFLGDYQESISTHHRKVIVVSHSQGNLYANTAFDVLGGHIANLEKHFEIIAVATPDSSVAGQPYPCNGQCKYVTLFEDKIATLVFPLVNAGYLSPNVSNTFVCLFSSCHNFVDDYLGGSNSRAAIKAFFVSALPPNNAPISGFQLSSIGYPSALSSPPEPSIPTMTVTAGGECACALISVDGGVPKSFDPNGSIAAWKWIVDGVSSSSPLSTFATSLAVGTHTISLIVTDDEGAPSSPATAKVVVLPSMVSPLPPSAVSDTYSMFQGTISAVPAPGVLSNDTYPSGASVEFLPPLPTGFAMGNPNGSFTIDLTSNLTFLGTLTLHYVIHSVNGDSNTATATIRVDPIGLPSGGGPYGGSVKAIVVDPSNPSFVYVLTRAGIFRSVDSGEHWVSVTPTFKRSIGFDHLLMDPTKPQTLYAASAGTLSQVVSKTTDGGLSWVKSDTGLTVAPVLALAMGTSNPDTLYASTAGGGLYRTTNGAQTWSLVNSFQPNRLVVSPFDALTVFSTTSSSQFTKSTNGGVTWTVSSTLLGPLATDPVTPGVLYAGGSPGAFYKSVDNGQTWVASNAGLPTDRSVQQIVTDPHHPQTLVVHLGSGGIYRSLDGGQTWIAAGLSNRTVLTVAMSPTDDTVYAGTEFIEGISRTTDGGQTWASFNAGMTALLVSEIAIDPANSNTVYASGEEVLFKSVNGGKDWVALKDFATIDGIGALAIDPHDPSVLYVGVASSPYKSTDDGATWAKLSAAIPFLGAGLIVIDPVDSNVVYAASASKVMKTTDGGSSWSTVNLAGAKSLAIDPTNSSILYSVTNSGSVQKSVDGGATWTPTGLSQANALVIDPLNAQIVYAIGNLNQVKKTTDGGQTWVTLGSGIPCCSSSPIAIDPINTANLYVGVGADGIFKTVNAGLTWSASSTGLTFFAIETIVVDSTNPSVLYAGTSGFGVFKSTNGGATWQPTGK